MNRIPLIHAIAVLLISQCGVLSVPGQSYHADEGFTEPMRTVDVASSESGVLQSLLVREGDSVRAGDLIGKLDCQVLEATLAGAKAKLDAHGKLHAATATLEHKAHHLKQMNALLQREHASDKEVKQAELDFQLAAANLETANDEMRLQELELKKIEAQIERRMVRAPSNGVVLALPCDVGEAVTSNEGQLATIVCLEQLRVRYFLTTEQASLLTQGERVTLFLPETGETVVGAVDFVSPVTDSESGTVRVEVMIENPVVDHHRRKYRSGLRCVLDAAGYTNIKTEN